CFGGAGGQHACLIAEALGIQEIFIHPYAGVLSAYGMGLADLRTLREQTLELPLAEENHATLIQAAEKLAAKAKAEIRAQGVDFSHDLPPLAATEMMTVQAQAQLRYSGTDSVIPVSLGDRVAMTADFEAIHQQQYGFTQPGKALIVATVTVEVIAAQSTPQIPQLPQAATALTATATVPVFLNQRWQDTPVYQRDNLPVGTAVQGPALILEATGTNVVEPGWTAHLTSQGGLVLTQVLSPQSVADPPGVATPLNKGSLGEISNTGDTEDNAAPSFPPDPIRLEIFNNLFRAIAEEMGVTLQNTSYSVNIKERLDFSCALFDGQGQLVANAPHIPVHLGSMGESVQSLIQAKGEVLQPGDVYAINNPYNGGTHLPDITVITPVWLKAEVESSLNKPVFYLASRGHHADVGGIAPGSMPADSTDIAEEGILFDHFLLVSAGDFQGNAVRSHLSQPPYPARNPDQNIADLQAQVAANNKGAQELHKLVARYGLATVQAYMVHVQNNAENCVRQAIIALAQRELVQSRSTRAFTYPMDNGRQIQVAITLKASDGSAIVDFTGTSPQQLNNFNAPLAVCKAAVLYVFRTLINDDIPLNAGCLKPISLIVPPSSLINPTHPAAVVAGNVETSQAITNALYGALGILAASQGTMNNLTFGNEQYQYYETICGGSGAGPNFAGTDAVQTHMTNSRLTDPEVLEWRFPVVLEKFEIRSDSGGQGQQTGGDGVIRQLRFCEPMTVSLLTGHRQVPPFGLAGGAAGQVGRNTVLLADGAIQSLSGTEKITLSPGDRLVVETPGGGGYGSE
ncbi:MAG: hydantoinase B/oxoprolinase family protein, partial [Cyanobacteria bacterium P01_A01_bin.105]